MGAADVSALSYLQAILMEMYCAAYDEAQEGRNLMRRPDGKHIFLGGRKVDRGWMFVPRIVCNAAPILYLNVSFLMDEWSLLNNASFYIMLISVMLSFYTVGAA